MPEYTDDDLDAIVALWSEAGKMRDEADEMEAEARDLRFQSEEKLDEADVKIAAVLLAHPEWRELLDEGVDPRVAMAEAALDEADFQRTGE